MTEKLPIPYKYPFKKMYKNCLLIVLFFVGFSTLAQIKGVVKDSITGLPIPYVNISVENENLGTTSEENGEFTIHISEKSKNLVFSALGFEKKITKISQSSQVLLKPTSYQLDEVVISKRFETREKEIGKSDEIFEAFDNGPRIDTKYFAYLPEYKKTKYIKQVVIFTDSKIDDATFKIHFYTVDANGFPGEQLLEKDFIVSVNKGVKETRFNLTKFNLRMPKQGLFVGFEKLMIAKNKLEKTVTDPNTKTTQIQRTYYPLMLYNVAKRDYQLMLTGGKWIKQTKQNPDDPSAKMTIYEPAINLILTN
jgi:hypothetical protein